MQLYWVGCSQVSSNYFRSFLHSCEVADFVNFIIPGDPYSHFTSPFTSSWAFFGRVALESVVKSGEVEGKLGWWFGQNSQTQECPCAYTMIVQKTKPVPAKGRWKMCVPWYGPYFSPLVLNKQIKVVYSDFTWVWHQCISQCGLQPVLLIPDTHQLIWCPSSGTLCSTERLFCFEEWE